MLPEKRALVLVGVYRADWQDERFNKTVIPVVAGCLDETVWEHQTDEETTAHWAPRKEAFDPHGTDYDWREVWVTLDPAGLRQPFELPVLQAKIEEAEA